MGAHLKKVHFWKRGTFEQIKHPTLHLKAYVAIFIYESGTTAQ
jgi:hypothetical protein